MPPPTTKPVAPPSPKRSWLAKCLAGLGRGIVWIVLVLLSLWALAALYIDTRLSALRLPLAILYAVVLVAILVKYKLHLRSMLLCFGCFCLVLFWWLSLKPTNTAACQAEADSTACVPPDGDT